MPQHVPKHVGALLEKPKAVAALPAVGIIEAKPNPLPCLDDIAKGFTDPLVGEYGTNIGSQFLVIFANPRMFGRNLTFFIFREVF